MFDYNHRYATVVINGKSRNFFKIYLCKSREQAKERSMGCNLAMFELEEGEYDQETLKPLVPYHYFDGNLVEVKYI